MAKNRNTMKNTVNAIRDRREGHYTSRDNYTMYID